MTYLEERSTSCKLFAVDGETIALGAPLEEVIGRLVTVQHAKNKSFLSWLPLAEEEYAVSASRMKLYQCYSNKKKAFKS